MTINPPNILELIDDYAKEKYRRYPWQAGAQRSLLRKFAEQAKLQYVSDITREHIAFFAGEELSIHYGDQALLALRQFLWYCRKGGYKCLSHNACRREELQRIENGVKISDTPSWELEPQWK